MIGEMKKLTDDWFSDFSVAGRVLRECKCNNSHSGNLSRRDGSRLVITRTGAMLGSLAAEDVVETSMLPTDAERRLASSEIDVHLGIYEAIESNMNGGGAIAHGHALWAVLAGWLDDELVPIDVEGAYYFGAVPVLEHVPATKVPELGRALGKVLSQKPVVILRGHGVFAVGDRLELAAQRIASVNDSAELIVRAKQLGLDIGALSRKEYLDFS
jgi:L-fuculose-phosphate aldolase